MHRCSLSRAASHLLPLLARHLLKKLTPLLTKPQLQSVLLHAVQPKVATLKVAVQLKVAKLLVAKLPAVKLKAAAPLLNAKLPKLPCAFAYEKDRWQRMRCRRFFHVRRD